MADKEIMLSTRAATNLLSANVDSEIKQMAHKLMRLTAGGRKLNENQAVELAVFSFMCDLNPFNGEAYYMTDPKNPGPIVGVSGVRRKANEQLWIQDPTDRFFGEFREAVLGEADFDPDKGDIGVHATIRIASITNRWQGGIIGMYTKLTVGGMDSEIAWKRAEKLAGPEPVWTAVGVVDHREKFSREPGTKGENDPGTPDKWDRHERAEKRAEKWALRKAFPSMLLPDIELGDRGFLDQNVVDGIVREVRHEIENPPPPRAEAVIMEELGFPIEKNEESEPEPEPEEVKSWDEEFVKAMIDNDIAKDTQDAVLALNFLSPADTAQAIEMGKRFRGFLDQDIPADKAALKTLAGESP